MSKSKMVGDDAKIRGAGRRPQEPPEEKRDQAMPETRFDVPAADDAAAARRSEEADTRARERDAEALSTGATYWLISQGRLDPPEATAPESNDPGAGGFAGRLAELFVSVFDSASPSTLAMAPSSRLPVSRWFRRAVWKPASAGAPA